MTTFIALLRGINIGGHKRIKMSDLKRMLENMGLANVQTYIQSGNVIFQAAGDAEVLRQRIEQEIELAFGFTVPVILRTAAELNRLIENCPYPEMPGLNVAFLSGQPSPEAVQELLSCNSGNDDFHIVDKDIYVLYKEDMRKTLLTTNFFEKKLKVYMTMRNWNTVSKLADMGRRVGKGEKKRA